MDTKRIYEKIQRLAPSPEWVMEAILELNGKSLVQLAFCNFPDEDAKMLVDVMLQRSGKGTVAGDVPWQCTAAAFARVSPLMHSGACIGTAVRLACTDDGMGSIVLVARSSVEEGGACLPGLSAFGSPLKFMAARPDLDVAVFRGAHGPGFQLQQLPLQVGTRLGMLSYPQAVDAELAAATSPPSGAAAIAATADAAPMVDTGVVSRVSTGGRFASASMYTGVPNSSDGAVLSDSDTVAGRYTGTVWHPEEMANSSSPSSPSSSSSSTNSGSGDVRAPRAIERNPNKLWTPPASIEAGDAAAAAAGSTGQAAAELSRLNLEHKNSEIIFTTASALWELLQEAGVASLDTVQVAAAANVIRMSNRRRS